MITIILNDSTITINNINVTTTYTIDMQYYDFLLISKLFKKSNIKKYINDNNVCIIFNKLLYLRYKNIIINVFEYILQEKPMYLNKLYLQDIYYVISMYKNNVSKLIRIEELLIKHVNTNKIITLQNNYNFLGGLLYM